MTDHSLRIGKLDAARRQLDTAITLWFNSGDPVSIHTLAYAAYEIIHTVSKKRDPNRRDMLFDTLHVKDEYRQQYATWIKSHANFFKHGDRDGEAVIDFHPSLSDLYIMFCVMGVELCGERHSVAENAWMWWLYIQKPDWLTESGKKLISNTLKPDDIEHIRSRPKSEFLNAFKVARAMQGRG